MKDSKIRRMTSDKLREESLRQRPRYRPGKCYDERDRERLRKLLYKAVFIPRPIRVTNSWCKRHGHRFISVVLLQPAIRSEPSFGIAAENGNCIEDIVQQQQERFNAFPDERAI